MLAWARTFTLDGIVARPVRVEVDVHRGLPAFSIVGLPDTAVREARERVRAAIVNSGFDYPQQRVTVNLAPANVRKAGPWLDLAIAAALLSASDQLDLGQLPTPCFAGELALDGRIRPVPGVLAIAEQARQEGMETIIVPADNAREAALAQGLTVVGLEHLAELAEIIKRGGPRQEVEPLDLALEVSESGPDLADLRGQRQLRQALEIAAAGGHNLLMVGPPGVGKSLAARRLPSILPSLSRQEALEVARIASARGQFDAGYVSRRPFRAPHHTISAAGLIGGGVPLTPGEVTLAHRGVLFLDELGEFRRDALEALRAPMEEGRVSIVRSGSRRELPCRFMLVAASNPCPCGRGEGDPECTCSVAAIRRYESKLSGALADRIEIVVSIARPKAGDLGGDAGEPSSAVRARVERARARQAERLGEGRCNAEMSSDEIRALPMSEDARTMLMAAFERDRLSGRAYDRILKLAQTVVDLNQGEIIGVEEVATALTLRRRELS
jgi:magnesium chelatase family protein